LKAHRGKSKKEASSEVTVRGVVIRLGQVREEEKAVKTLATIWKGRGIGVGRELYPQTQQGRVSQRKD